MADKGLFDEFDPFTYKKNIVPTTPMMSTLSREDKERMDESFFETFETSQHMETSEKQDMHMVYDMVESLRIECAEMRKEMGRRDSIYADLKEQLKQRDSAREKENLDLKVAAMQTGKDMQFLMDKMTELTSSLLDRKPITDSSLSKEQSKLADLEVTIKKKPTSKTVSFKSDEAVHEALVGSKELESKIVTLKSNDISSEKKTEYTEPGKKGKNFMKPATFDGSSSWIDYKSHFDMCAELNGWTHDQKGLYLGVSLRGLAQGVLGNLPTKDQKDFETLCNTLGERFSPESQTELYRAQLKEREWKHGENLGEFSQRILRLTTLAYPRADPTLINVLAMGFFIDSISDAEMRLKIQQTRPKDLNEAVKVAVELEAFDRAERQRRGFKYGRQTDTQCEAASDLKKILNIINEDKNEQKAELRTILEQVSKLSQEDKKKSAPSLSELVELINHDKNSSKADKEGNGLESKTLYQNKAKRRCYICNDESHLANRCPVKPKCFNCQEIGHKSFECPQNRSRHHRGPSKDQKQVKRSGSNFEQPINLFDAGIYCCGVINGVGITALVDSGATATMVSDTVYSKLPSYKRPLLEPVGCKMIAANGQEMTTFGVGTFTLSFNGKQFELPAIVADMNSEIVLGVDFMQKFSCVLDMKNCTITTEDLVINCFTKGKMGCFRISAAETVSIPSNNGIVIPGALTGKRVCLEEQYGIIEPYEQLMEKKNILSGRVLARADSEVPVRLMNPTTNPIVIRKGTIIGTFEPIAEVKEMAKKENEHRSGHCLPEPLQDLVDRSSKQLDNEQKCKLKETLLNYQDVFALNDEDMGFTEIVKHQIHTEGAKPIKQRIRRLPHHMAEEADKQVDDMLKRGVIEESNSPWAAGVVLVKKKDGSFRFCVDYRALNDVTVKDAYPLPKISETLDSLSGAKWFSTLDLYSGYWQVGVENEDKPKTAFITRKGLFQFRVLPFGLCNAPATFERLMEVVLAGLQWDICLIYLDDIITFGKSFDEAVENLEKVLDRLRTAGLKLKPKKCELFSKSVSFLGHIISDDGVATEPEKIKAVQDWPVPIDQTEVRSFLGLCGYYRRFIKGYAEIAKPMHTLTENGRPFVWT